jgi:hypothetical protein
MHSPVYKALFALVLTIFILLNNPVIAAGNISSVNSSSVNRTFITIDPIGNHSVGETFAVEGTTNLPLTGNVSVDIRSSTINRTSNSRSFDSYTLIPVMSGQNGTNRWSTSVSTANWTPGKYLIGVDALIIEPCYRVDQDGNPTYTCAQVNNRTSDSFEINPGSSDSIANNIGEEMNSVAPTQQSTKQNTLPVSTPTIITALIILICFAHFRK